MSLLSKYYQWLFKYPASRLLIRPISVTSSPLPHPIYLFNDSRCWVTIRAPPLTFFPDHLPLLLPSSVSDPRISRLISRVIHLRLFLNMSSFSDQLSNLPCPFLLSTSNSLSTHLEFLMKSHCGLFHISPQRKMFLDDRIVFVTTSPTQQGSTLPHLNWSENIYRQRLWSTHCHKVSQSFPKLIGPFVFLFSCLTWNSDFI